MGGSGVDSTGSWQGPKTCSCQHDKETVGSIKFEILQD